MFPEKSKTPAEEVYQEQHNPQFQKKEKLSDKKRKQTLDTWEKPLWPPMARTLFICLLVLSVAMTLVEIKNAYLSTTLGITGFLKNVSLTLLILWIIVLCLEALCSVCNASSERKKYMKRKKDSGLMDTTEEERARTNRALKRLNAPCRQYVTICAIGTCILLILYILSRIL